MVMAQGFTREQVKSILDDVDGSDLIDKKTKKLLHLAEKTTRYAYKVTEEDIKTLKTTQISKACIIKIWCKFFCYVHFKILLKRKQPMNFNCKL